MRRNSAALSRGLRPARPAFFSAARPSDSKHLAQRCTVCRCTPSTRATSAWLSPCRNKLAARRRRASSASKSRFTPRGLPMPAKLYQTRACVNYIMRDSIVHGGLGLLSRLNAYEAAVAALVFELHEAGDEREERVVLALPDV